MVNASTAGLTTRTVLRPPPCPLLSAFPEVPNTPAAPSPWAAPAHPGRASAAPCASPPSCSPSLSLCNISKSCLGSARGILPGLLPSGLHVLRRSGRAQPEGTRASTAGAGSPPHRHPADAGSVGLARVAPRQVAGASHRSARRHGRRVWPAQTEVAVCRGGFCPASRVPDQHGGTGRPVPSWSDRVPGNHGMTFQILRFKTGFSPWRSCIPWGFGAFSSLGITCYLWSLFKNYDYLNLKKKKIQWSSRGFLLP